MNINNKLHTRLIYYFVGLFIMTLGIALSVKSDLGVSPVSSIPYTLTCVFGIEMGNATILFHVVLVLIQIALLRRDFKIHNVLQILIGIVFGKFTTLCNYLVGFMILPDSIIIRLGLTAISALLIAIGIFFYMPANIMPLAGEGVMQTVAGISHVEFAKVKVSFDVSMVVISLITCLLTMHSLGSVGLGTVIAAFLVGIILGALNRRFGQWRDQLLGV